MGSENTALNPAPLCGESREGGWALNRKEGPARCPQRTRPPAPSGPRCVGPSAPDPPSAAGSPPSVSSRRPQARPPRMALKAPKKSEFWCRMGEELQPESKREDFRWSQPFLPTLPIRVAAQAKAVDCFYKFERLRELRYRCQDTAKWGPCSAVKEGLESDHRRRRGPWRRRWR